MVFTSAVITLTGWPAVVISVKWIPNLVSYSLSTKVFNETNKNLLPLHNFPYSAKG